MNGKEDLKHGKIIFIGDAEKRIKEDYLRILRYFRFFALYSKTNHNSQTLKNIKKNLNGISRISSERLLDEFKKIVISDSLQKLCDDEDSLEILKLIFPQFKKLESIKNLNPISKQNLKSVEFSFLLGVLSIDETDNLDYFLYKFNISKKDQKRIKNMRDFFFNKEKVKKIDTTSLWKHYYYNGKESLLDILNYKIVGKDEADIKNKLIYFKSPIGKGLIGKNKGDLVEIKTPAGDKNFEIKYVKYL